MIRTPINLHPKKFFAALLLLTVVTLLSPALPVFATFSPGETLNPNCAPTDPNCTVVQVFVATSTLFFGIGTTTPQGKLSVSGQVIADYFSATAPSVSTFFFASTTALTVSGNSYLNTVASGVWNGSAVGATYGGTGLTSYARGDLLYASGTSTIGKLAAGIDGQVLKISGGVPVWGTDLTSGGSLFTTSSNNRAIVPSDISQVFLLGTTATSTTGNIFEVAGNSLLGGNLAVTGQTILANASTTALTVSGPAIVLGTSTLATTTASRLSVTGTTTLATTTASQLSVSGAVLLNGALTANGAASFNVGATVLGTSTVTGALSLNPFGTATGNTTPLIFNELAANGTNYVGFKAPDSIAANLLWTLPNATGTTGQVLSTDSNGVLSWSSAGGASTGASGGLQISNGVGGFIADAANLFWDNTLKRLGIGTGAPSASLAINNTSTPTVTKATTASLSVTGSAVTGGITVSNNKIALPFVNALNTSINTLGAVTGFTSNVGAGSNSRVRPDGKFFIVYGNGLTTTSIYDPVANTFVSGPNLSGAAGADAFSLVRTDGQFLIVHANGTAATSLYDPVANTVSAGPTLTATVGAGSHTVVRPDGKFLIVHGGGLGSTSIYDPTANTVVAGPTLLVASTGATAAITAGAHSFTRADGRIVIINGSSTTATTFYDPVANTVTSPTTLTQVVATSSFALARTDGKYLIIHANNTASTTLYDPTSINPMTAGPALTGLAGPGTFSVARANGTFLIVHGNGLNTTSIYDPTGNTMTAGPTLTANAGDGAHSFVRPTGIVLIVHGNNLLSTTLYDPAANTMSAGPVLSNFAGAGAHSFVRPDGRFVTIHGNTSTASSIYDSSTNTFVVGPTFTANVGAGASSRVRPDGKYWVILGGATTTTNIYDPVANTVVAGPALSAAAAVGSNTRTRPDGKFLVVHGGGLSSTSIYDPVANTVASGPTILNANTGVTTVAGGGSFTIQRTDGIFLVIAGNSTNAYGLYDPVANIFSPGPSLTAAAGAGASTRVRPDGKFFVILGGSTATTNIYDPVLNAYTAGPSLSGVAGVGSHTFIRPADGKFFVVHGGNLSTTSIYDPVANTVAAGPTIITANSGASANAGAGANSFVRPDGKFVIIHGNSLTTYSIYDPVTNVFSAIPTLTAAVGAGAHSFQRPDGKFIVLHGGTLTSTSIYDPITSTVASGPTVTTGIGVGAHAYQIYNGKFMVLAGNNTTATSLYEPTTNSFTTGPVTSAAQGIGAHSIQLNDGRFLVVLGGAGATATSLYNPVANTFATGPTTSGAQGAGAMSIQRPNGTFLTILGNASAATNVFDQNLNTFVAGPTVTGNVGAGAHAIQLASGKFLVILGNSTNATSIYDPATSANTFTAGPTLTDVVGSGAHAEQRADGKFLIVHGGGLTTTSVYDPVTNTVTAGPVLLVGVGAGGHSFQRPDGRYTEILGGAVAQTNIYDGGWTMTGTYESEDMNIASLNANSIMKFDWNGEGILVAEIKTATTQVGLAQATYIVRANGALVQPVTGAQWVKVRMTLTRPVPQNIQPIQPFSPRYGWKGESETNYQRMFVLPVVNSWVVDNESIIRKDTTDFGEGVSTTTEDTGPLLLNVTGSNDGLTLPYRIGFSPNVSTGVTNDDGGSIINGTPALNAIGGGSQTIQRPNGTYLILAGNTTSSTNIYDPATNTFTAGPIATANIGTGAFSFQRPDGKFFVAHGAGQTTSSIYDPIANTFTAGPTFTVAINDGANALLRPDGKFLIIHSGASSATSIYDPIQNTIQRGPSTAAICTVNAGTLSILRPDGRYLIPCGSGTAVTMVYDGVQNQFSIGPAFTVAPGTGLNAFQRPDGKFIIVGSNGGTAMSNLYDPTDNTLTSTTLTATGVTAPIPGTGSFSVQRPDGSYMVAIGGGNAVGKIFDPTTNNYSTFTDIPFSAAINIGAHAFQRPDGKYVIFQGGGSVTTQIYDPGFIMNGYYQSEIMTNTQLDSQSALSWTGNADAYKTGAVSVAVRTATSSDGITAAAWRTIKKSGDLISPGTGETFMQVRFSMQRTVTTMPGAGRNVWSGSHTTQYDRMPITGAGGVNGPIPNAAQTFIKPIITGYRVTQANNANLATFSVNDNNLFRFSATGDAFTGGGSWNAGGADVAEYFPTNDATLEAGDIVTIEESSAGLVRKSNTAYDANILGIVTTTPGVKLGIDIQGGTADKQPIALVGRVPLKVSLENGSIKKGDYITSSSQPGVGMRATQAGRVVAIALESFDASDADQNGMGTVLVYVNPHMFLGQAATEESLLELLVDKGPTGIITDYMKERMASGLTVIQEFIVGKIVAVIGWFDTIFTRQINVSEKLCIGQTCIGETELRILLNLPPLPPPVVTSTPQVGESDSTATTTAEGAAPAAQVDATSSAETPAAPVVADPTPAPVPVVDPTPAPAPVVDPTPEATPAPVADPTPAPSEAPAPDTTTQ